MSQETCQGQRADGTPCRSWALSDSRYCWYHDPTMRDKRQEAVRKGGQGKSAAARMGRLLPARLKPVLDGLIDGQKEVHAGTLSPQQYSTMAVGAGAICKLYGVVELEVRLAALEKELGADATQHRRPTEAQEDD